MDSVKITIEDLLGQLARADNSALKTMEALVETLKTLTEAIEKTNRRLDKLESEVLRHWNRPYINYPD